MKAATLYELESVYEATIQALTDFSPDNKLDQLLLSDIFAPSFQVYLTTDHEQCMNLKEIKKLLEQKSRENNSFTNKIPTLGSAIFKSFSPDGNTAVFVDELQFPNSTSKSFKIRLSTMLFKTEHGWRVVHLHASIPAINTFNEKIALPKQPDNKIRDLEKMLEERDLALNNSLNNLKTIQAQLVRQEKLASLGKLTAGIAHEIKNPLNFVINFSDLSVELLEEAFEELSTIKNSEAKQNIITILGDIKTNLNKISQHGNRADSTVKSMLKHSRGGSGKPEPVKINDLIREYVNLSFHGMRAGKRPINVTINLELDETITEVSLIQEDFSRVILNLCNNAFDAMREKLRNKAGNNNYSPQLTVRTIPEKDFIKIEVGDNGPGVSPEYINKILQPFFTTKKEGEGTGLGLSITQDIIKAHSGELHISSKEGEGTTFIVQIPKT